MPVRAGAQDGLAPPGDELHAEIPVPIAVVQRALRAVERHVFPGNQVDRKPTTNVPRGFHPKVSGRMD